MAVDLLEALTASHEVHHFLYVLVDQSFLTTNVRIDERLTVARLGQLSVRLIGQAVFVLVLLLNTGHSIL
ncbi:hypothetical protein PJLMJKDB_00250 [Klebsiella phage 066028]|nr:hypothetical protein PJLMJKDB_00250 [Klebsiella phage 066028]